MLIIITSLLIILSDVNVGNKINHKKSLLKSVNTRSIKPYTRTQYVYNRITPTVFKHFPMSNKQNELLQQYL